MLFYLMFSPPRCTFASKGLSKSYTFRAAAAWAVSGRLGLHLGLDPLGLGPLGLGLGRHRGDCKKLPAVPLGLGLSILFCSILGLVLLLLRLVFRCVLWVCVYRWAWCFYCLV